MISTKYTVRIYYRDIDQMGVVYYAHYFEYFEAARTELLRTIGLEVRHIEENGYFLPVLESNCKYKNGARFDDVIEVEAILAEKPEFKVRIDYKIILKGSEQEIAEGYTIHVFTRQKDGKPVRVPSEFSQNFENV